MSCDDRTPVPIFEPQTGFLCLTDGQHRQVVARVRGAYVYLMWKGKPKREVRVRIGDLFNLIDDSA